MRSPPRTNKQKSTTLTSKAAGADTLVGAWLVLVALPVVQTGPVLAQVQRSLARGPREPRAAGAAEGGGLGAIGARSSVGARSRGALVDVLLAPRACEALRAAAAIRARRVLKTRRAVQARSGGALVHVFFAAAAREACGMATDVFTFT